MTRLLARPTRRRRRSASGRRAAVRAAVAALLLVAGLAAGAAGLLVQSTPEQRDAQLLGVGQAWTAPERPAFVGDLVVYGTPAEGKRPELAELGCQVTSGGGPLSTERAAREDRLVVEGRGLVPLVSFPGEAGHSIGCVGPAAEAAAPLYVVPGRNQRHLVPVAGYCVAALFVPLGAFMLLSLRAGRY